MNGIPKRKNVKTYIIPEKNSDYYRRKLSFIVDNFEENFNYNLYTKIPIVTRKDFLENSHSFKDSSIRTSRLHFSGGTLGKPKKIKCVFKKALDFSYISKPSVITVDKPLPIL